MSRSNWNLSIKGLSSINESSQEHISKLVLDGNTEGEIIEDTKRGYWSINIDSSDESYHEYIANQILEGFTSGLD